MPGQVDLFVVEANFGRQKPVDINFGLMGPLFHFLNELHY
jgi:hypothetical protein